MAVSVKPKPDRLGARFLAFVVEQHPFAYAAARRAWTTSDGDVEALKRALLNEVTAQAGDVPEATPFTSATQRLQQEAERLAAAVDAFFAREEILASITADEKKWMLRGIILTRAVDNKMKQLFLSSEMKYGELGFQGKGFRSLGQEAIYAAALRLNRNGDVVGPLIRDLGIALAFTDDVEGALNAQVGKAGPPSWGKDLHLGDPERGVVMAAAPLSIATCTVVGHALAFSRRGERRVAFSFIGEGGSSLGEWHEAINFAAALRLPCVFCVQNNQTALSTPVHEQSKVRVFAEKALGYGVPYVSVDGTDPEAVASAFAWAAERARRGLGPVLIETIAMRLCGHAHHDDMLYLGADPALGFAVPPTPEKGYVDKQKYAAWAARDPLASYARKLIEEGVVTAADVARFEEEAVARVDAAAAVLRERPWPSPEVASPAKVYASAGGAAVPAASSEGPRGIDGSEREPLLVAGEDARPTITAELEVAPAFDPKGSTYLEAIGRGLEDVLSRVPEAFLLGEDVGPPYGNAFLLLKPLVEKFGARMINTTLAEGAIIGACVGSALAGMRPIGEIQFNDFVASGFNQLVNNAAKLHFRGGRKVPLTLRMPWGGLRRAGPYHSQDTSPWFYRAFGLKIVAPSTPRDARALMMSAVLDDNPVLYYEHIALYRDPKIKQRVDDVSPIPLGTAAFRRLGSDLSLIAYGAYVHKAMSVATKLAHEGLECDVLDLRSLAPLDWARIEATVKRTGKVLLVGEDSRTGSILESIASQLGERCFLDLDGPIRVLGSLDTPVPYSPSLEDAFLLSEQRILDEARALASW